jgi:hypothetical protein
VALFNRGYLEINSDGVVESNMGGVRLKRMWTVSSIDLYTLGSRIVQMNARSIKLL